MKDWIGRLVLIVLLPVIVPGVIVLVTMLTVVVVVFTIEGVLLRLWFWLAHVVHGRRVLFVYSNSPNWQSYVEANILPRLGDRVVLLNWSERRRWWRQYPCRARFLGHFAGDREFNPCAIVCGRFGRIRVIRFYRAFRDAKHGKPAALDVAEAELFRLSKT